MKKCIENGRDALIKEYITNSVQTGNLEPSQLLTKGANKYANRILKEAAEYEDKHTILKALEVEYLKSLFMFYRDINHLESVEMRQMRNKINNAEVWKDEQRLFFLDKMVSEARYKTDLVKQHKELKLLKNQWDTTPLLLKLLRRISSAKSTDFNKRLMLQSRIRTRSFSMIASN